MRKADFYRDYEAALAAASQATAGAQLLGAITGELQPPMMPPPPNPAPAALFVLAFRDGTVHPAVALWTDHLMVHYITPEGAHEQIRPDRVDWQHTSVQSPGIGDGGQVPQRLPQVPLPH